MKVSVPPIGSCLPCNMLSLPVLDYLLKRFACMCCYYAPSRTAGAEPLDYVYTVPFQLLVAGNVLT